MKSINVLNNTFEFITKHDVWKKMLFVLLWNMIYPVKVPTYHTIWISLSEAFSENFYRYVEIWNRILFYKQLTSTCINQLEVVNV